MGNKISIVFSGILLFLVIILSIVAEIENKSLAVDKVTISNYEEQNKKLVKDYQDKQKQIDLEKKKSFEQASHIKQSTSAIMKIKVPTDCESAIQWAIAEAIGL